MTASKTLAERVAALRDEVLSGSDPAPDDVPLVRRLVPDDVPLVRREPSGSEVFDAVIRLLSGGSRASAEVDLGLHDGIARRLAWRDGEMRILGDAREVCRRILSAARRALRDPDEEMEVAQAVAETGTAAARILTLLVLGRVARERAALVREELAHERLGQATERQREELARLERALADALARSRA